MEIAKKITLNSKKKKNTRKNSFLIIPFTNLFINNIVIATKIFEWKMENFIH